MNLRHEHLHVAVKYGYGIVNKNITFFMPLEVRIFFLISFISKFYLDLNSSKETIH